MTNPMPRTRNRQHAGTPRRADVEELLGYLNFSNGTPDAAFQRGLNALFARFETSPRESLLQFLSVRLEELAGTSPAFADVSQARAVLELAFGECPRAYRRHHADLLFHLAEADFDRPFLLARMAEAVLAQGPPWSETGRVLAGAVERLNDFVGYRPLAVLENGRTMQPYPHEAFRPVPLFIREAGVANGPARELIEGMLALFGELSVDIQREAYFDLDHLDEFALDVRAYDHLHPVNKRTNYIFGEWDPHVIDNRGFYRRFVMRKMILDALLDWIEGAAAGRPVGSAAKTPRKERLFDASAVLCGTVLMATAISGSGPGAHDSTVSLTALLPQVARQRDLFYAHLLQQASGARARRLRREAERTQQPFGHVRQHLNIVLSRIGARQVHDRFLTQFFARLGFPQASREQAARIPCPAGRFESEIGWRLTAAQRGAERGDAAGAVSLLEETRDLLRRGIECGALADPWNILGFQGQFPLFQAREDVVPDQRIDVLLDFVQRCFDVLARVLCEASAAGDRLSAERVSRLFRELAEWWDRFASTTVSDLPPVHGGEAWESAASVAEAVAGWRNAGEAAGDISFWRQHVENFQSPQAYGRVVETLLQKGDCIAAMGLLMQWLSRADEVGFASGGYSLNALLEQWVRTATRPSPSAGPQRADSIKRTLRRLFDHLEANAGEFWSVPALRETFGGSAEADEGALEDSLWEEDEPDEEDGGLFEAAYEGVVYRDSAEDGETGDTLEEGFLPRDTEIEAIGRDLEPRLDFLKMVAELWQLAAEMLGTQRVPLEEDDREMVRHWVRRAGTFRRELGRLLGEVSDYEISPPTGSADSNMEFDIQMQARYYLQHKLAAAAAESRAAEWSLLALFEPHEPLPFEAAEPTRQIAAVLRAVYRGDTVTLRRELPGFLKLMSRQPLLYVSLENGGDPAKFLAARSVQSLLNVLLKRLPQRGLLAETWNVLTTAYRMERASRPSGTATTEFDRLLKTALKSSLRAVVRAKGRWPQIAGRTRTVPPRRSGTTRRLSRFPAARLPRVRRRRQGAQRSRRRRTEPTAGRGATRGRLRGAAPSSRRHLPARDAARLCAVGRFDGGGPPGRETLLSVLRYAVDRYQSLWLRHSRSVRLSPVELLQETHRWDEIVQFIKRYGHDLLHAPMLMLSNIRAILHQGADEFLDFLEREQDPLHPLPLLDDIESGRIDRDEACSKLEFIYECILDRIDRFIEYNTTTTQSDYGGMFYCLLDFLRVEAAYDRDAWNLRPFQLAHEVLAESASAALARDWEEMLATLTRDKADAHLKKLRKLQETYSMRLPSIADHLGERFVKATAVNRMRALIAPALAESRSPAEPPRCFPLLREEIDRYLESTAGSAIDVPEWLSRLDAEIQRAEEQARFHVNDAAPHDNAHRLRPRQVLWQLTKLGASGRRRRKS